MSIDEVAQQMCSGDNTRARHQQEERFPVRPAIPVHKLVSGVASRVVFRMGRTELPSLSIGRASENIFRSAEDMPIQGLIQIIDNEPKFRTNLMSMLDLQLSFGKLINSFGWCATKIPILTTQNSRNLYVQAATEETRNINKRMYWVEMEDLNKLSALVFLSKLVIEALPALCLIGKLEFPLNGYKKSSNVLGELVPLIEHLTKIEDWRHLSEISVIPVEGNMSLATIIRGMTNSIDARLKGQVVSSLRLLCHWQDVANKASYILNQMPATTLSDLQQNIQNGQTEKDLQAKASVESVYVNEYCTIDIYAPRIIDLNTTNLVTYEEAEQDVRMMRIAVLDKLVEKLVVHTYGDGIKNEAVNFYELQWEQQMQLQRLRAGLVRQTLLVDFNATLDTIKKDLSIDIMGKIFTSTLFTNLSWKFDPVKAKKNELFEGNFKLFYRYGYPIPMHVSPINPQVPVCVELETSGRMWQVNELAIQDHRMETTPGLRELLQDVNVRMEIQVKKMREEIQVLDGRLIQHMIGTNQLLENMIISLNRKVGTDLKPMNLDGTICVETSKLNLASDGTGLAGSSGGSGSGAVATESFFGISQPMDVVDDDQNKKKESKSRKK